MRRVDMDTSANDPLRQKNRAGKGRAGARKQHPGVQLREPRDRQPGWVARFRDPETGGMRDVRMLGAHGKNKATATAYCRRLSEEEIGEYRVSDEPRSPHSVNKGLRALSAILNGLRASDVVRLTSDEIKDATKRYRAETEHREFLGRSQIHELIEATKDEPHGALVRALLLTGLRLEEVLGIEWRDVDHDVLHVRAATAKGGAARDVDLSVAPTAMPTTKGAPDERVFSFSPGEVRGVYERSSVKWSPRPAAHLEHVLLLRVRSLARIEERRPRRARDGEELRWFGARP